MIEIPVTLIAPFFAVLGFTALITQLVLRSAHRKSRSSPAGFPPDAHVFEFKDGQLVSASDAALNAITDAGLSETAYPQLLEKLGRLFPDLTARITEVEEEGKAVELSKLAESGPIELRIDPIEDGVRLALLGHDAPFADLKLVDLSRHEEETEELRILQELAEISPVPTWRETSLGQIDWVNNAYRKLVEQSELNGDGRDWPPVRLFSSAHVASPGTTPRPRRSALKMNDGASRMYETLSLGQGDRSVHFAIDATATALAEDSLRNFAQTLTQTFAELPVGLAIFDQARHLVMFNPALMELTSLKPNWLTAKPTLYDFLNQLREQRMIPERKDFKGWRDELVDLERSATKGTYLETWTLPTGQIYRVIGRPHPQGAIAFFFEDITSEMALTRKVRGEKKLQDDMLDAISDAVVAFDGQGKLRASNRLFAEMWGSDPCASKEPMHIQDVIKLMQLRCHPSPIWGDIRDFCFQTSERAEWTGSVIHRDGRSLTATIQPLAGHITMISFSENDARAELPPIARPPAKISQVASR